MKQVSRTWFAAAMILVVVGAIINFYGTNMVLSDISNAYAGLHDIYFISSIPMLMFAFLFVLALLYIGRRFLRPQYRKSLAKLYTIIGLVFSLIGFVTSILSGTIVYHTFTGANPFPGYCIMMLILFAALSVLFVFQFRYAIKMPDDPEKRPKKVTYGIYSALLVVFMYFAINRLGAFLWSPVYVQGRTFYLTWPYYLWLLMPVVLLSFVTSSVFHLREVGTKSGLIKYSLFFVVGLAFTITILVLGTTNTQFVSAISPTVGVERLLAKPVDTILQVILFLVFSLFFLIREIVFFLKKNKEAK